MQEEARKSHFRKINSEMILGWMIIAVCMLVAYLFEVLKREITLTYMLILIPVVLLPLLPVIIIYCKKPDWQKLCYFIVSGYFVMYLFVMITGKTSMVFSYILPLLSLLILCHQPRLILITGIAALCVNVIAILGNYHAGLLTISNSKDAEIQLALIVLCFGGGYFSAKLYDSITNQNHEYFNTLHAQNEHIQAISLQTLTTIANMMDAKDSYTEGHSQRVSIYSAQIAKEIGMSKEEIESIRKVALLHDIGKIGVPDSILNKPGWLSSEEFIVMKNHAIIGGEIIKDIKTIPGLYDGVRYHHERYDGKGYPEGLKGEEIPYVARIIAVADAYDAMTSTRVYRKHLNFGQVVSELENGSGTQFDPIISHKMIDMINTGVLKNISPDMATN